MATETIEDRRASDEQMNEIAERQRETAKAAEERLSERRAAEGDATVGWTVQQGAYPGGTEDTRQKFHASQLPDPAAARAAGIQPLEYPADLVLEGTIEEAATDPQGPDPSEVVIAPVREKLRARMLGEDAPIRKGGATPENPAELDEGERSRSGEAGARAARSAESASRPTTTGGQGDGGNGGGDNEAPAETATRGEWNDYAVNVKGADREEVEALPNKEAVIEKYGS